METPRKGYVSGDAATGLSQLARWFKWFGISKWRFKPCSETDIRNEIQSHIAIEMQEQLAAGKSPQEAQRLARLAFGSALKAEEDVREVWRWVTVEQFFHDFRLGIRTLRKSTVWTASVGATLILGIGVTTAIFSLVYSVLLQSLPYPEPDRIVALWPTATKSGGDRFRASAALWKYWHDNLKSVEQIALTRPVANFNLTGAGTPERLQGARSTFNVPLTLGVKPSLGRYFTREEQLADARVAVLSHGFWARRFGSDPSIISRKIQLNGEPFEVIGVMPPDYAYPDATFELWTPLYIPAVEFRHGVNHQYLAIGRLRPGASIEQARAEMAAIAGRLAREYPAAYRAGDQWIGGLAEPLADSQSFSVRGTLLALMAADACLLLIGCMNLAVLLIARASARSREMAMRLALGASGRRLRRQLVTEVLPLGICGAVGGALLASGLIKAMLPWLPADLPQTQTLGLNAPVLAFAIASSLAVVIAASLLPALIARRADVNDVLQQNSRTMSARGGVREILVMAQIALAVVLVFAGALLGHSLAVLQRVSPGFSAGNVLTMHLAVTRAKYKTDNLVADYYHRIVASVKTTPGVLEAGIINRLPLGGLTQNGGVQFEGREGGFTADWRVATPGYFAAMAIPVRQGRAFSDADRPTSARVGIIDSEIARRVFGSDSPVGKRFRRYMPGLPEQDTWVEIVGVVGHVLNDSLEKDLRPQVYWPESQSAQDRGVLVVRTAGRPDSYTAMIENQIRAVDPDQPVYEVRSMKGWVAKSMQSRSLTTTLSSVFGMASLTLACLGIYGVLSYTTEQRFREFGIRMALGADRRSVRNLVFRLAGRLSLIGVGVGLILCWPAGRLLTGLLFGVSSLDVVAWILAPALLISTGLLAALGPALRAERTSPADVLRSD
jgi:predicted permease